MRDDEGRGARGWDGEDGRGTAVSAHRNVGVALVHQNQSVEVVEWKRRRNSRCGSVTAVRESWREYLTPRPAQDWW